MKHKAALKAFREFYLENCDSDCSEICPDIYLKRDDWLQSSCEQMCYSLEPFKELGYKGVCPCRYFGGNAIIMLRDNLMEIGVL